MCGIAGIACFGRPAPWRAPEEGLAAMGGYLAHRGPDGAGVSWCERWGVGLAHRRLAIQDTSDAGAQPMRSASGRFEVVFNGEIYNFPELREELAVLGRRFRGGSDTEVLLAACEVWGLEAAVERFVGMFAFALLDREAGALHLVRDRLGEKPLYYGVLEGRLYFASELRAMRALPGFPPEVDPGSVALLTSYNCIPAPHTIYRDCYKLPPASILSVALDGPLSLPAPSRYWHPESRASLAESAPTPEEAVDRLDALLLEAVRGQMLADVPLGAFLSGGIDSSLIVASMQAVAPRSVQTFSIGFEEAAFDESRHAAAVAAHLGTRHTELRVGEGEALGIVPELGRIYSEPFADASQIPTVLVAQLTRRHVTVALSGDGGDELFYGYPRYEATLRDWHRPARGFGPLGIVERGLGPIPVRRMASALRPALAFRRPLATASLAEKIARRRSLLSAESLRGYYAARIAHWAAPPLRSRSSLPPHPLRCETIPAALEQTEPRLLQWLDLHGYLPDDILVKVDRAAMAASLETRVPLLDHRIVEFAQGLPREALVQDGQAKWMLRRLLARHLPPALFQRPKQGFAVPLGSWLRGPLASWADALLDPVVLQREGLFDAGAVRGLWTDHRSGREDFSARLWSVLMYRAWAETQ